MNAPAHKLRSVNNRHRKDRLFLIACLLAAVIAVLSLVVLLTSILVQGISYLSYEFLSTGPSRNPEESGILPAMVGTMLICAICAVFAIPVGIATAILLEEYKPKARVLRWLHGVVQTNITNLAGVPSIVYGILGISTFAMMFNAVGSPLYPEWTIGQYWYNQYLGADGRSYYVLVEDRREPPVPALAREVDEPRPFEVRRTKKLTIDPQSGAVTAQSQELILGDLSAEQTLRGRLVVRSGVWNLVPEPDAPPLSGLRRGDRVRIDLGLYTPSELTITATEADRLILAGGPLTRVLNKPKGREVEFSISSPQEVEPVQAQTTEAVAELEAVLREAIGRSPQFTAEEAAAVAEEALAKARLKIEDPATFAEAMGDDARFESLGQLLRERLMEMSGLSGRDVGRARRSLLNDIERAELSSRLGGVIIAGTNPLRVDHKNSWYEFPPYMQLPFGRGVFAGGLTLMLVVLPIIIVASQESLRAVPTSLRHGSLALGGTKWQAISTIALPAAIPGICTGAILAMSRAIGEAAPILILAGVVFINFLPANLMDDFTAMPLQIYNWASRPQTEFHKVAASGIIILLAILLSFNALAVFIRMKFTKPLS